MKNPMRWMALIVFAASTAAFGQTSDPDSAVPPSQQDTSQPSNAPQSQTQSQSQTTTETKTTTSVSSWPKTSRTAADALTQKYGQPDQSSDRVLTWTNKDPWERVTLHREGVKDTFPVNHVSYIEDTVSYAVPKDRTTEIENFDPAITVDKDAQTITSRSDSEAGNILALNLADEIARGKLDASQARDVMRRRWREYVAGKSSPYTDHLLFKTSSSGSTSPSSSGSSNDISNPERDHGENAPDYDTDRPEPNNQQAPVKSPGE